MEAGGVGLAMRSSVIAGYRRRVLELDHAIWCVPGAATHAVPRALHGFAIEPGRVHAAQGTRNVRVMFARSYLEVLWIERPELVAQRGLDFGDRCARPARRAPFGCVLRGRISVAERARFRPYELPDAPGMVLQILDDADRDAPFVAVFETDDVEAGWPVRRAAPEHLAHAHGAREIVRATFTCPAAAPIAGVRDVRFTIGAPRLELELDRGRLVIDGDA